MADSPLFTDLLRIGIAEALTRNQKLTREEAERRGSDLNIMLAASAAVGDENAGQIVRAQAGLYLDTAKKKQLDRLVYDRYGILRKPAAASYGQVQFSTTSPAAAAFTIPDGTQLTTPDGILFGTVGNVTFPLGSVGPITADVRSVLAGATQVARAGTIVSVVTTITGAPTDLVVTNSYATFGADDEESDGSLVDRARAFFTTARRGTTEAIRQGILAVPGIETCSVFELVDRLGRPYGYVEAVIADRFTEQFIGGSTPTGYQIQMASLTAQIESALLDYRAAGVAVRIRVAEVILQAVQLALTYSAGYSEADVADEVRSRVVNLINTKSPAQGLTLAEIREAISTVPGLFYTGHEVISPTGNVNAQNLQVLRTSMALVNLVN